ncbi:hypothetical protein ACWCO0_14600 [Streptomyces tubercidicus]
MSQGRSGPADHPPLIQGHTVRQPSVVPSPGERHSRAQEENRYLEQHGFAEYRKWYLGEDDEQNEENKSAPAGLHTLPVLRPQHSTRGQLLAVKDRIDQMLQQFDLTDDEREASKETAKRSPLSPNASRTPRTRRTDPARTRNDGWLHPPAPPQQHLDRPRLVAGVPAGLLGSFPGGTAW